MKKLFVALLLFISCGMMAQNYKQQILDTLVHYAEPYHIPGGYTVRRVNYSGHTCTVQLGDLFESLPFRTELLDSMTSAVKAVIAPRYKGYDVVFKIGTTDVHKLIPNYYLPEGKKDLTKFNKVYKTTVPFVRNLDRPYNITKGLQDRNLALWQSHGLYYNQSEDRWMWQRARVFTTVEDKFTLSFMIPYLMPMLERAGANVMLPRERDYNRNEVVVDNDGSEYVHGQYRERGKFKTDKEPGFGYSHEVYTGVQNPFEDGTFRKIKTTEEGESMARWTPDIPEDGWYWVSVSYKTIKKSVPDAKYTVRHSGGETTFTVNQTMGGGTWIYLGRFYFEKGENSEKGSVTLTNESKYTGEVTADAVRFGGGMGNVARRPMTKEEAALIKDEKIRKKVISTFDKEEYSLSGVAKFWEAAMYWLQWAGAPRDVISVTQDTNDYTDDYSCRGAWVNWLNQGSVNTPDSVGLGIPIDLAMAFHSDAGCKIDTVIGTLGIYTTIFNPETKCRHFPNGQSRYSSRDLADLITWQIVDDIRASVNPNWVKRWMWDKSYNESRRPEVPTMLLELLSHQNFEDMKYGLDPRFKFIVSRAIYKGMAKFITSQNGEDCVIAPLPVNSFAVSMIGNDKVRLSWRSTTDSLEPTAEADCYVVYSRKDGGGWDNGVLVEDNEILLPLKEETIMSYKVVAVNAGGASMDSEILSAYYTNKHKECVMIVNGFDRVSGPEGVQSLPYAGFPDWTDRGVGDGVELQYVGRQHDFDTRHPWISDDDSGWGQSNSDYEFITIAGNSHDFPYVHGKSIAEAGYSFVSASRAAVENECVDIKNYEMLDLILGEQKETLWGNEKNSCMFRTFSLNLQGELREYAEAGGSLMVTGAYVVSDSQFAMTATDADRRFLKDVLRVEWRSDRAATDGRVETVFCPNSQFEGKYHFCQNLNESVYSVESPDAMLPVGRNAHTIMRYSGNKSSAAVAYSGLDRRTWVAGFPFETIEDEDMRDKLMKQILDFLIR